MRASAWKLARACYWLGTHGPEAERRAALDRGLKAGEQAAKINPNRPEGYFWQAANMGALAESFGLWQGLKYRGKRIELRREKEIFSIGRDEGCNLVVHDEQASRQHCTIERRKDKFVLKDVSTNGTYVTIDGDKEMELDREELMLSRRGWITFGQPRVHATEVVEFFLGPAPAKQT